MDMALHLKGVGGTEHVAKFFTMAWWLWGRRNKFIYENVFIDPRTSIKKALWLKNYIKTFLIVRDLV